MFLKVRCANFEGVLHSLPSSLLIFLFLTFSESTFSEITVENSPNNSLNVVERSDEELLVLEMRLGNYILSDGLIGYSHRGGALLSIAEVFQALEFAIDVDYATGQATGWFLKENRLFSLDIERKEVVIEGRLRLFDPALVELHFDGIYVDAALLSKWFPVKIEINLSQLVVEVTSQEQLPLERRLEREKIRARLNLGGRAASNYPRTDASYSFFDLPFIDANLNLIRRSPETGGREARYNGLVSGDLLFMNSVLFVAGIDEDSLTDVRLTLGRSDPDGHLLGPLRAQSFRIGDIFSPQIPLISNSRAGMGGEISNFPLARPSEFDRTTLQGELLRDWVVELYRNEVLLDFQDSRADGRYEFTDVPLLYGANILRLIFYGPQGQEREEVKSFRFGTGMVKPGQQIYRFGFSRQDQFLFRSEQFAFREALIGEERYQAELERGLGQRLTIAAAGVSLPFVDGRRHYASLGLRSSILGTFSRLDLAKEIDGGRALQFATRFNLLGNNIFAEHGQFFDFTSERVRNESDPVESLTRARLDGAVSFWPLPRMPFSFTGLLERRESGRSKADLLNRLSMYFRRISITHTLRASITQAGTTPFTRRINAFLLLSGRFKKISLRTYLSYNPPPDHVFNSLSFTADYKIPRNFSARFSVSRDLLVGRWTNYSAGINRTFDAFLIGLEGRYQDKSNYSIQISISFSLGLKPRSKSLHLSSRRMGNNGAASVRVFLDNNLDGIYDLGDELLEGVQIRHGGRTSNPTNKKGIAYIPNLSSYRPTDITIDIGSLEDPFWIPINEGVTVVPRPGKSISLEFPVIVTGEVDGTVYLRRDTAVRGVSNVVLELVNKEAEIVMQTKTAFDGFYLFTMVPPGQYIVRISREQVKRLNLEPPLDSEVVIEGDGTIVSGVDIIIERTRKGEE